MHSLVEWQMSLKLPLLVYNQKLLPAKIPPELSLLPLLTLTSFSLQFFLHIIAFTFAVHQFKNLNLKILIKLKISFLSATAAIK